MIKPPTPVDELLRLETLRNLKILDTDPEDRFDRVTRLAKRVFNTPVALVSLIDNDRQWFKSKQGLSICESSRDISFCAHTILDDAVMVVSDTRADERFHDNPLVCSDPGMRFYAGYPLSAPNGQNVGTLCVADHEPRELTDEELGLLIELGQMVEEELAVASMMHNDPVTGLCNGVGFSQIAQHLLAMCDRNDDPAAVMLVHFSNQHIIEGFAGPEESDRAAIELAAMLMASFRDSDIVARVAVDAFAVLLAGSRLEEIEVARDRLEERIAARNASKRSEYELEVETFAAAYHRDRHADVGALLSDVKERMAARAAARHDEAQAQSA